MTIPEALLALSLSALWHCQLQSDCSVMNLFYISNLDGGLPYASVAGEHTGF